MNIAAASLVQWIKFDCKGELHKVGAMCLFFLQMSHASCGSQWVTIFFLKALVRSFWLVIKQTEIVWATKANKTSGCKIDYFYNRYFQCLLKIASTGSVSNREICRKQTRIAFAYLVIPRKRFRVSDIFKWCNKAERDYLFVRFKTLSTLQDRIRKVMDSWVPLSAHSAITCSWGYCRLRWGVWTQHVTVGVFARPVCRCDAHSICIKASVCLNREEVDWSRWLSPVLLCLVARPV